MVVFMLYNVTWPICVSFNGRELFKGFKCMFFVNMCNVYLYVCDVLMFGVNEVLKDGWLCELSVSV